MSNSPRYRLPQRQNTKSMLLVKVSNTSKSIQQPTQIRTSIHSELFQKMLPLRDNKGGQSNHSNTGVYNNRNGQPNNFRGRGSSYGANRGNMNNSGGGGFNRNFSGPQMGGMAGGFQPAMGGFQGGQMGGQMGGQFGGFNRGGMMNGMRGGPGGMRGGRGGMGNGMMGGMPMGGMPIGAYGRHGTTNGYGSDGWRYAR